MHTIDPAKTPRILSSQQAADRMGLPVQVLYKLRDADERLSISQTGLQIGYQLEDIQSYERSEMQLLLEKTLATERPLPLIRAMAQLLRAPAPPAHETPDKPPAQPSKPSLPSEPPKKPDDKPTLVLAADPPSSPVSTASRTMDWFLVRSKPRQEAVALTNLARQGYESYLPMFAAEKIVRRKQAIVQEPMFARYLFVRLDTTGQGQSWSPIRSTIGVSELVCFGSKAARVDEALIGMLREREAWQSEQPKSLFASGDSVVIADGAFAGLQAIYQMNDAEGRAMVLLDLLSKPVAMRINAASLRKVG
jgi:transcriptional antiterminator RfaH